MGDGVIGALKRRNRSLNHDIIEDSANLPDPDVLAAEIIEDLQSALEELRAISDDLALTPGAREGDKHE
jgi:type I restriction enzyme M protein